MKRLSFHLFFFVLLLIGAGCTQDSGLTGDEGVAPEAPSKPHQEPTASYTPMNFVDLSDAGYGKKVQYLVSPCQGSKHEKEGMYGLDETVLETLLFDEEGNPVLAADGSHLTLKVFRKDY